MPGPCFLGPDWESVRRQPPRTGFREWRGNSRASRKNAGKDAGVAGLEAHSTNRRGA